MCIDEYHAGKDVTCGVVWECLIADEVVTVVSLGTILLVLSYLRFNSKMC